MKAHQKTKLIKCGDTTFVYDFNYSRNVSKLGIERDNPALLELKRLLMTNFEGNFHTTVFTLQSKSFNYEQTKKQLKYFLAKVKGLRQMDLKALAIQELPSSLNCSDTYIHCATNIKAVELSNLLQEHEEEYFSKIWGDKVLIDFYLPNELLSVFETLYSRSIKSPLYRSNTKILIKSKIQKPMILWDEHAESFIKSERLLDYPYVNSIEIHDRVTGFTIVNEYSKASSTSKRNNYYF